VKNRIPSFLSPEEAKNIAIDACIFGYPLVLMDTTRSLLTSVANAGSRKAPMNQFLHLRRFPDSNYRDVVSPNVDTLYSSAWIDLLAEPVVLSVPAMNRYYVMQMLDAWTNVFAAPGTRTTGNEKQDFAIAGPWWRGILPEELKALHSPTRHVWIVGRTQTNGESDYDEVHAIQDQYRLMPLSAWNQPYSAPADVPFDSSIDIETPPVDQVANMDAEAFLRTLNRLMKDNPPAATDLPALRRLNVIGVAPGNAFSMTALEDPVAEAVEKGFEEGKARITAQSQRLQGRKVNGWEISPANTANFGRDYIYRAVVAMVRLGANLREDAMYPRATTDLEGRPLTGEKSYVIRFQKRQLPPVNAFWSITAYNSEQFFDANAINRYAIRDRDKLTFHQDGSLTIHIGHNSPDPEKGPNWLPVPAGSFSLCMRLYWPKEEALAGSWKMPGIERID
jgi:hypothetical protein